MKQRNSLIRFLVNPVFTYTNIGWSPKDAFLAGTEESVVEWASELSKRHTVEVYYNGPTMTHRGVKYLPRDTYRGGGGITINIKSSDIEPQEPTWYLTNETNAADLDLSKYEGIILPSKWALDNLGIDHPKIRVLPHGYDPKEIYPEEKMKNQCLYSSSPDRGLSELVDLWPQVVERVPDATLVVTYDGEVDLPNTICLGSVPSSTMNELYRCSDFWLHPCLGGELFGMAGIKAQVAQAIPVFYPTMALAETIRHGVRAYRDTFVDRLVQIMESPKWQQDIRYKLGEEDYMDWEETARLLEDIVHG